jgi:hypothetical protein
MDQAWSENIRAQLRVLSLARGLRKDRWRFTIRRFGYYQEERAREFAPQAEVFQNI